MKINESGRFVSGPGRSRALLVLQHEVPMCYTVTDEVKDSVSHRNLDYGLFCKIVHQLAAHSVCTLFG